MVEPGKDGMEVGVGITLEPWRDGFGALLPMDRKDPKCRKDVFQNTTEITKLRRPTLSVDIGKIIQDANVE